MSKYFTFRNFLLLIAAFIAGIAFFAWTLFLRNARFNTTDFALTVRVQDKVPLKADQYLLYLSEFASFPVMLAVLVLTLLLFRKWLATVTSVGFFGLAHIVEIIGKGMLDHPPPPFRFYRHPNDHAFIASYVPDHSSYPSGHSLRVIFVGMVVGMLIWNYKRIPFAVKLLVIAGISGVIFLTLLSRVSLGEHWSSDVIGGILLGICFGCISLIFLSNPEVK